MTAYVPPHKLRQATGGAATAAADTGAAEDVQPHNNNTSSTNTQCSTRGGGRAGFNGRYGRGSGRGWSARPTRVDASELYKYPDIVHHFWPDKEDVVETGMRSTFHDSASRGDQILAIQWRKEEYFPQPTKHGIAGRRRSEPSQTQGNTPSTPSGADEGLKVKDDSGSLDAQRDLVSGPQDDGTNQHDGEITSSPAEHKPDDNAEPVTDSHQSPKTEGDSHQLVSIPPLNYVPSPHAPIAVFEEAMFGEFRFARWHSVARVSILAPHSPDLVRMLQQKWERQDCWGNVVTRKRDPSGWRTPLNYQWAVVKFEKLAQDDAPAAPTIEKLPPTPWTTDSEKVVKGVSEMLNDLRLKDQGSDKDVATEGEGHRVTEQGEATPGHLSGGTTDKRENIPPPAE
ncbi:hypothetical protein PG994_007763 [Apiospora phragmitis]|uniref:Uncharacterized protein n=1 Tax=Apiospora phragmitis TaxID=2905665 RepID=A0ABR1UR42_9PEZI